MTLQQLRYIIKTSELNSIRLAAEYFYVSQPNISKAIKEIEEEFKIIIFKRTNKGVVLTEEGNKFLSYARNVVEQADSLENNYKSQNVKRMFAISSQHYAFVVNAFVNLIKSIDKNRYEFSLKEQRTSDIIEDVKNGKSDIGIIYLSKFNELVIRRILDENNLEFKRLAIASTYVFVSKDNPLAKRKSVKLSDLVQYPRLTFDQGIQNSFYYNEEPYSTEIVDKSIIVSDRATLFNLLIGLNGYTISSGILSEDLNGENIVSIPLIGDEKMEIGYIYDKTRILSDITNEYIEILKEYMKNIEIKKDLW